MAKVLFALDRRDFEKWLEGQGERGLDTKPPCECPLSEYLSRIIGEEATCTHDRFWLRSEPYTHRLPRWARCFSRLCMVAPASALLAALREIPEDERIA